MKSPGILFCGKPIFCLLVSIVMISLCGYQAALAQNKYAVVIGIGDYPEQSGWKEISGDKDVDMIVPMLLQNGFARENITVLVNSEATKSAIRNAISDLAGVSGKGDIVYIHFSGHGQQVTDLDGDETDGYDEAIIPYDAASRYGLGGYKGENHILDDEFGLWLEGLRMSVGRKGLILVALDACHSGDATRGNNNNEGKHVRGTSEIFMIPDSSGQDDACMAHACDTEQNVRRNVEWICISACKSYQNNYEYKSETGYCGRLSWAISRVMRPGIRFSEFVNALKDMYGSMPMPSGLPQDLDVDAPEQYDVLLF